MLSCVSIQEHTKGLCQLTQPLWMVGKTRLELATTRPPDVYANQLRYFPIDLRETESVS